MQDNIVGYVQELFVYPVKSMRGIAVSEASCYWYGVNGDRKYAFTRSGNLSGFPWLTGRELPALLKYAPYFVEPHSPMQSPIRVKTPEGGDLPLEATALHRELAQGYNGNIELLKLKRGTFDCMPLSLITTETISRLEQAANRALGARRFRPNILVKGREGRDEAGWSSATLVFGQHEDAARIQVNYPIERCVMINLDPDSTESDARVLKAVARVNDCLAGIYAAVSRPGMIRVGDPIYLYSDE